MNLQAPITTLVLIVHTEATLAETLETILSHRFNIPTSLEWVDEGIGSKFFEITTNVPVSYATMAEIYAYTQRYIRNWHTAD